MKIGGYATPPTGIFSRKLGIRSYVLTDHLGNVRATFADMKKLVGTSEQVLVQNATNYYPFGMEMPGRTAVNASRKYRFGFNGKEKENSVGQGGYDFGARLFNSQTGTWFTPDPHAINYPSWSPYNFCGSNPIMRVDKDGKDWDVVVNHETKTITILANFTTYSGNLANETLQKSVDYWNSQSGKFNYSIKDGDKTISYSINFNVSLNSSDQNLAGNDMSVVPDNSPIFRERIEIDANGNEKITQPQGASDGKSFVVKKSQSSNDNVVSHEMGHNFGMNHTWFGLMKSTTGGKRLNVNNIKETLGHSKIGYGIKNSTTGAQMKTKNEIGTTPNNFNEGKVEKVEEK